MYWAKPTWENCTTVSVACCKGFSEVEWCSFSFQCRTVKITIIGNEGVPVQVDGEAWIQPPGFIYIAHKNRAQMLTRDKVCVVN